MKKRTVGVELLVQDILATKAEPYSEDIILEVCKAIEANAKWEQRYRELSDELRQWVVNNWIGQYVKARAGLRSEGHMKAEEGILIKSYTRLVR